MDSTVRVALTVEQRADKADVMAVLISQIGAVKAQAKAKAFEFRDLVEGLMDQLEEHARVLNMGHEQRSQLDLTFPESEAAKALHDVAAAAEETESDDKTDNEGDTSIGEQVDVGTVEEPAAVAEFREAKARRKRA